MVNQQKVTEFINALLDKFENKVANKKTDLSGDYSTDTISYPTVKGVKEWVTSVLSGYLTPSDILGKVDKAQGSGNANLNVVTDNIGNISLEAKPTIPDISGKIDTAGTGLSKSGTTLNHSNSVDAQTTAQLKKIKFDAQGHITDTANVEGTDLPSHSHSNYVVSVSETTTETGYLKTYIVTQNGSQVGAKINIPKDYLVKSASLKTCETADVPVQGYKVGDKYLDFVINTKDSSTSTGDEHLYILVSDLIDTYTADGVTLEVSNNQFNVKNGGIGTTQLSSGVNTSLGYADAYNNSVAKDITQQDITNWNGKSTLSISDVDNEIDAYLDALINTLTPSS